MLSPNEGRRHSAAAVPAGLSMYKYLGWALTGNGGPAGAAGAAAAVAPELPRHETLIDAFPAFKLSLSAMAPKPLALPAVPEDSALALPSAEASQLAATARRSRRYR